MKRLYISEYFVSSFAPIIELVYCTQTSKMSEQEFTVRIPPRNEKKNYHIMKFNANLKVDVGKWNQVSIIKTYLKAHHGHFRKFIINSGVFKLYFNCLSNLG